MDRAVSFSLGLAIFFDHRHGSLCDALQTPQDFISDLAAEHQFWGV